MEKLNKRNHLTCSDHSPLGFVLDKMIEPRTENGAIIVVGSSLKWEAGGAGTERNFVT